MILVYIVTILLLILSGLFSGLTLGLMSLDAFELRRKKKLGNKNAVVIYPLRKQGNLLLVTLLLGNVAVNSALAVFLGSITTGVVAGLVSTALIVVFGEILPQSFFARHALKFGARLTWLVWIFLFVFYPVGKPLAMMLDFFLGGETPESFSKKEIREILLEQKKHEEGGINDEEYSILTKGLFFSEKQVKDIMTPRVNVFFLKMDQRLTRSLLLKIQKSGHSRIPVISKDKDDLEGILYTKDLIALDPSAGVKVKQLMRKKMRVVREHENLGKVLKMFKRKEHPHLFIVKDKFGGMAGIVTLEDVLEEIIGEIVDEHDTYVDMRTKE